MTAESYATGCAPIGGAETSISLELSFQRQESGIANSAPAAAAHRAVSNPAFAAIHPQSALPAVIEPNMTVKKIDRPRPRTQSGKASCAETYRTDSTTVQAAPAISAA